MGLHYKLTIEKFIVGLGFAAQGAIPLQGQAKRVFSSRIASRIIGRLVVQRCVGSFSVGNRPPARIRPSRMVFQDASQSAPKATACLCLDSSVESAGGNQPRGDPLIPTFFQAACAKATSCLVAGWGRSRAGPLQAGSCSVARERRLPRSEPWRVPPSTRLAAHHRSLPCAYTTREGDAAAQGARCQPTLVANAAPPRAISRTFFPNRPSVPSQWLEAP